MSLRDFIARATQPPKAPMEQFGMHDLEFFVAVLRACPVGARLGFDHSEPEDFVRRFSRWAYRENPDDYEADYYRIEPAFIAEVEAAIEAGTLRLDHHLWIADPAGHGLFQGMDDFCDICIDEDLRDRILEQRNGEQGRDGDAPQRPC